MTFLAPAQFWPPKCHWKHQQTFGNIWPYANTLTRTKRAPNLRLLRGFLGLVLTLRNGVKNRVFAFFHFPPIIWLQNRIQNHELLNERSVSQLSAGTFGFHLRALVRERRSTKDKWLKLTTLLESSAIFAVFFKLLPQTIFVTAP